MTSYAETTDNCSNHISSSNRFYKVTTEIHIKVLPNSTTDYGSCPQAQSASGPSSSFESTAWLSRFAERLHPSRPSDAADEMLTTRASSIDDNKWADCFSRRVARRQRDARDELVVARRDVTAHRLADFVGTTVEKTLSRLTEHAAPMYIHVDASINDGSVPVGGGGETEETTMFQPTSTTETALVENNQSTHRHLRHRRPKQRARRMSSRTKIPSAATSNDTISKTESSAQSEGIATQMISHFRNSKGNTEIEPEDADEKSEYEQFRLPKDYDYRKIPLTTAEDAVQSAANGREREKAEQRKMQRRRHKSSVRSRRSTAYSDDRGAFLLRDASDEQRQNTRGSGEFNTVRNME